VHPVKLIYFFHDSIKEQGVCMLEEVKVDYLGSLVQYFPCSF
jgi:hypothetical protein